MEIFNYQRAADPQVATQLIRSHAHASDLQSAAQYIAGGTNMTDYMTLEVLRPKWLIDINHLSDARLKQIEHTDRGIRFGALVKMSEAEDDPIVQSQYPLIRDTLVTAASRQIRNMATLGGNILQRTRCEYFRETSWPCNKRNPNSGCSALAGINRQHAILGVSNHCIATYAGDFAQALIALDATIEIIGGANGARHIPFANLHTLPGTTPHIENSLQPGELITFINVPAGPWMRRACYIKVRDRRSYQFAITSAAVALHMENNVVHDCRIALGGVATIPWRAQAAEKILKGKVLDERSATLAADAAFENAITGEYNAFKVPIGKQTIVRALLEVQRIKI